MGEMVQERCRCSKSVLHSQGREAYLKSFPPGYRFTPTDEELVQCYLRKKVRNEELPINMIHEVHLYQHNPRELSQYPSCDENNWYFFTPRDRKYPKGRRPRRDAKGGYWKATGGDEKIIVNGIPIASKRRMSFYLVQEQSQSNGKRKMRNDEDIKTSWIMHEYRLNGDFLPIGTGENGMLLDTWVLCRVLKMKDKDGKPGDAQRGDETTTGDPRTKIGDDTERSNQQVGDHYSNTSMTRAVVIGNSSGHNNGHGYNDRFLNQQRPSYNHAGFHPNVAFGNGYEASYSTLDHNLNRMSSTASGPAFHGSDPSTSNNGLPYSNYSTFQTHPSSFRLVGSVNDSNVHQEEDVILASDMFVSNPTDMPPIGFGNQEALMSSSFPQSNSSTLFSYTGSGTDDGRYSHGSNRI